MSFIREAFPWTTLHVSSTHSFSLLLVCLHNNILDKVQPAFHVLSLLKKRNFTVTGTQKLLVLNLNSRFAPVKVTKKLPTVTEFKIKQIHCFLIDYTHPCT